MKDSLVPQGEQIATGGARAVAMNGVHPNDISIQEIWRILRKRRWAILGVLVGSLLVAGLISAFMTRRYEAVGQVLVNPQDSNALGIDPLDALGGGGLQNDIVQQTQVQVLQSDPLAWEVIRQLRLDQREDFAGQDVTKAGQSFETVTGPKKVTLLATFHKGLRVSAIPKTQLIEVRFRARDPKIAADVVNALTNGYIERNFRTRYQATMQASDWLSKQLNDLKNNVEASQQRFTEYQKKSGIIGTDDAHNVFITQLDELNKAMAAAEADRIMKEANFRVAASGNPETIAQLAPSSTLAVLRTQQADLNNQFAQLSAKYGDAYPRVVQLRSQLEQVQGSIGGQVKLLREQFEQQYLAALKTEHMLGKRLEEHKQQAYEMNEAGIQYAILKRDFDSSRDLYQDLLKRLKEAGIVAGLKSTNVDVIEPAEAPIRPAEPRVALNLAVGLLLGTFGGIGLAFLLESLDTTVSPPESGEILPNLPVLGIVPHFSLATRNRKAIEERDKVPFLLSRPNSQFAEAFRGLRTTLLLSSAGSPPRVILISSAAPGEGKTTTSINCAVTLAQKGKRVLLVDADLRRSGVERYLQVESKKGLSECLAGAAKPEDVVTQLPGAEGVECLPAGNRPPNPVELLDSERMRELLERWREEYDYVVLDTPPLVGLSDALVLSPSADAVILVARSNRTSVQSLRRARDFLARVNARTVGVVINDLNFKSSDYYGYYGYYGSKYGEYYGDDAKN